MTRKKLTTLLGVTIAAFILAYVVSFIPVLRSLELKTIDWRFSWRGIESVDDSPIVIVTIDDQSMESLPDRWPWPRSYYAHVVDNLTEAGAKVIGIDVIFDKSDPYGPEKDRQFAEAIRRSGRVVLTGKLEESQSYRYPVPPIPELLQADSTWGVVAIQSDADGIYRRYILAQKLKNDVFPAFGLQVLRKFKGYPPTESIRFTEQGVQFADFSIPFFEYGSILIDFAGPRNTFPYYSFDTVIDDEEFQLKGDFDLDYFNTLKEEGVFKDKIVLIGSTVSELHDNFPTPFLEYTTRDGKPMKAEMPGVEIHANAIRTILNNLYYTQPNFILFLAIILGIILMNQFISLKISTTTSTFLTIGIIFFYNLAQFYIFDHFRVVTLMVFPTMAIFLAYVANTIYQYIVTQREKQIVLGAFQHYVPEKVVNELLSHPEKLTLGGEERFLTVLFSDVAGFTSISERLTPRQLVTLINEYLSAMTEIILKHDGIIDKYEGDAIMAEFGAPVYYEDHAIKACAAALEMQKRLVKLNKKWAKENVPELRARVGINSGNMIVGNMGSHQVFDYTVMGDEVNLASRLEGANKLFNTYIMISESTYNLVKDHFVTRPLDMIRVKGKQKPVKVYELIAKKDDALPYKFKEILPVYINGITYYNTRQWDRAIECFQYCLRLVPNDGPSKEYLRRVTEYKKNPPPPDWDGVFTLTSK